jgi:hypothetical protein
MPNWEKVIRGLEKCKRHECDDCAEKGASQAPWDCPVYDDFVDSALALLKEQESTLGIRQTVDGITFISTGTAKQGEERGLVLGKALMREWLEKELLYRGLLTDDIRTVLHEAKYL